MTPRWSPRAPAWRSRWPRCGAAPRRSRIARASLDFGTDLRRIGAEHGSHVDGHLRAVNHDAERARTLGRPGGTRRATRDAAPPARRPGGLHRPGVARRHTFPRIGACHGTWPRSACIASAIAIPGGRVPAATTSRTADVQRVPRGQLLAPLHRLGATVLQSARVAREGLPDVLKAGSSTSVSSSRRPKLGGVECALVSRRSIASAVLNRMSRSDASGSAARCSAAIDLAHSHSPAGNCKLDAVRD